MLAVPEATYATFPMSRTDTLKHVQVDAESGAAA
jgi:hypothetical protein